METIDFNEVLKTNWRRIEQRGGIKYPLTVKKIFHIHRNDKYVCNDIHGVEYYEDNVNDIGKDINHYLNEFYKHEKHWDVNSQLIICITDCNTEDDIVFMFCVLKTSRKNENQVIWLI